MEKEENTQLLLVINEYLKMNPDITSQEIVELEKQKNIIVSQKSVIEAMGKIKQMRYSKPILEDVYRISKKWFHLKNTNRLDVVLAVAFSQKMIGTPLWLIVVAPSGDMKSEQLRALDDDGLTTKIVQKFTDKTLVNGFQNKTEHPDLAPKLKDKIMLILDMADILQLRPEIKGQIWAQLRDLYDGNASSQSGTGADIYYTDLRVTFLAGSTPAIDEQILIHQSLGTRELLYRPSEIINIENLMFKAWNNEFYQIEMREEFKIVIQNFIRELQIRPIEVSNYARDKIMFLARYLAYMRSSAPTDSYTGDLRGEVVPELPTRCLQQLKRLFICLMNLDPEYSEEKALEIIKEVVLSSIDKTRAKVLDFIIKSNEEMTTSMIAERLKMGKKSVRTECNILWYLNVIDRRLEENTNNWGQTFIVGEFWKACEDNIFVKTLRNQNKEFNQETLLRNIA